MKMLGLGRGEGCVGVAVAVCDGNSTSVEATVGDWAGAGDPFPAVGGGLAPFGRGVMVLFGVAVGLLPAQAVAMVTARDIDEMRKNLFPSTV